MGMRGLWYEHGYHDIAQVGASCQTLNGTFDSSTGTLHTDFAVIYGLLPFTIEEIYEPHDGKSSLATGVFRKSVKAPFNLPGGHLVGLPTSIVKATVSADKSQYETVVMYSCVPVLGVEEIVIATRNRSITDDAYNAVIEAIKAKGLSTSGLKRVNWNTCKKLASPM